MNPPPIKDLDVVDSFYKNLSDEQVRRARIRYYEAAAQGDWIAGEFIAEILGERLHE
jgi:hypothetical protein